MITFSTLGARSRLGNHLFQYAFLRTTAQRLGVSFYCPTWAGDVLFDLNDGHERSTSCTKASYEYHEPYEKPGFNNSALNIKDKTDIQGYFQSHKYLNPKVVQNWYSFKEEKISRVRKKYAHIDFSNSVGVHIRLGDFTTDYSNLYYVARSKYYKKALEFIPRNNNVIVFSDDIAAAKIIFENMNVMATYIENNEAHEDLYLQTQCRDFICAPSSFSWWGGWLNTFPDKVVIVPKEGPFRPGAPISNAEFWPNNWQKVQALNPLYDSYSVHMKRGFIQKGIKKVIRTIQSIV